MAYLLAVLISTLLDQVSKFLIITNFKLYQSRPIIGKFLMFTYTTNTGGAFGILSQYPEFFVCLAIILTLAGVIFARKIMKFSLLSQIAYGLLVGGTVGNLIDRLRVGRVIDFIDFSFWPTFNIADIAITVGVAMLTINIIKLGQEKHASNEKENV